MTSRPSIQLARLLLRATGLLLCCHFTEPAASSAESAAAILAKSGVHGGLIVHVGCGDGELTAALRAGEGYLVHGLDRDSENIAKTRRQIAKLGLQGRVTADIFDGKTLPFIDNVANLVVASQLGDLPMAEVLRVLVPDGVVTFVVGRSMFLDGGLRVCRLEVASGKLLGETVLDDRDPDTGDSLQTRVKGLNMPVALPDILSSDGQRLFMRSQVMDLQGNRTKLGPSGSGQKHLFAPYGFTDDSWFHRTYWVYGDGFSGGVGGFGNGKKVPAGRILVHNDQTVFGYGRKPQYYRWGSVIEYQLYAANKPVAAGDADTAAAPRRRAKKKGSRGAAVAFQWQADVPVMVRAMALAGHKLLIAGPRDQLDEDAAFQHFGADAVQKRLQAQDAALRGETGGLLQVVDAASGVTHSQLPLESPPVFDGLSVGSGHVYLATVSDHAVCLGRS